MKKPILLIASPIARLRRRWRQALKAGFAVHDVAQRPALERSMGNLKPAILLLDLALLADYWGGGLPAIQRFDSLTKIVLLTSSPDDREGISAIKAGARGYYNRDVDPSLLKNAVEIVQKGEIWVGRDIVSYLFEKVTSLSERRQENPAEANSRLGPLTAREREIARLIGRGASNKECASQLNVTDRTVKAHLTAIFRKLRLSGRLQLALFMTQHNRVFH